MENVDFFHHIYSIIILWRENLSRFVFKLQPLLNIKIQTEDALKNELGRAVQKLENEKSILRDIEQKKEDCISFSNKEVRRGITVDKLRDYNAYIFFLEEKIKMQKENVKFAQENVDSYREKLLKIAQEKQMLEKLKEKKYMDYMTEEQKQEQRLVDEVISFKYNKSIAGEDNG